MSKVLCINNGKIYPTQLSISRELGVSRSAISHHLGGECPSVCGKIYILITGNESMAELQKIISGEIKKRFNITLDINVVLGDGDGEVGEING